MYLFFDTETTGVPAGNDNVHMVQLAWILQSDTAQNLAHGNFIIRPEGWTIPDEATKIHGITTARANTEGVPVDLALSSFTSMTYFPVRLVGHNIDFDIKIVTTEYARLGWENACYGKETLCTMKASTSLCAIPRKNGGFKWPTLVELHEKLFGREFEHAHDALADIRATAKCFWELRHIGRI